MGIFNTRPRFQDRDMRQLSGDVITLSGDTNVDGVFRYKPGAVTGYVLTSADGDGTVMWSPMTGTTSGSTINIYNTDGVLTDDRTIDLDEHKITFSGTDSNNLFKTVVNYEQSEHNLSVSLGGSELNFVNHFNNDVNSVKVSFPGVYLTTVDGSTNDVTNLLVEKNVIKTGSDFSGFTGIEYNQDYSTNFVDRSLVDKEYVDNQINGITGITSGSTINIYNTDGLLTGNRVVGLDEHQISFSGTDFDNVFRALVNYEQSEHNLSVSLWGSELNFVNYSSGDENSIKTSFNGITLNVYDGDTDDNTGILVEKNAITTGSDFSGFTGIEYNQDYSTNFVDRSLVDKEYVDNQKPQFINYFEFTGNPITIVDSVNTWYKLNTDSTTSLFSRGDLVHTNNRVRYTGDTSRVFQIEGIININGGNNQEIGASFFRNGSLYPCSQQTTVLSSGGKSTSLPFHCLIKLEEFDYIEVFVKNITSTTDITLSNVNVIIKEM